jgi:transcriptional regulator with XRE-family HTH domain
MSFGTLLRQERLARGLTLREMATMIGVTPGYLSETDSNTAAQAGDAWSKRAVLNKSREFKELSATSVSKLLTHSDAASTPAITEQLRYDHCQGAHHDRITHRFNKPRFLFDSLSQDFRAFFAGIVHHLGRVIVVHLAWISGAEPEHFGDAAQAIQAGCSTTTVSRAATQSPEYTAEEPFALLRRSL